MIMCWIMKESVCIPLQQTSGLTQQITVCTSGPKMLQMLFVSPFATINPGPVYQSWAHFDNELMPDELTGYTVLVSPDLFNVG